MNLFAKGHKNNPRTEEEQETHEARDTRTYLERVADTKAEYGIEEMSDAEIAAKMEATEAADDNPSLVTALSHEQRARKNRGKTAADEDYSDAPDYFFR